MALQQCGTCAYFIAADSTCHALPPKRLDDGSTAWPPVNPTDPTHQCGAGKPAEG